MTDVPRAREIVMRYGWNATCYQILNPGIDHWFTSSGDAVVGYVESRSVRLVAGSPVCADDRLPAVIAEFEESARRAGERACYFGAAGRLQPLLSSQGDYAAVVLGAQPVWQPLQWAEIFTRHASLRAQLNRARNKGISIEEWSTTAAENHPMLRCCLDEWLATRHLPPLHFLVEPDTLQCLYDRRVFVALRAGTPVGFLIASPIPLRRGWLIEQVIRGNNALNGTAELLIDAAMRAVAQDGAEYATLGLVPLSRYSPGTSDFNPWWLRLVLAWVRAHGRRFYNFGGLDEFKAKFNPYDWEPIFAISQERNFSPSTLHAIAAAFCNGSPLLAVARSLRKALRQEAQWLAARLHR